MWEVQPERNKGKYKEEQEEHFKKLKVKWSCGQIVNDLKSLWLMSSSKCQ